MPNTENIQSNYTLLKLLRTGISPLSAMIGTSSYYGQLIGNPILGSINALLFSKKFGIDIWNLNQIPSAKTKLLNSSKKIILGLGTIGLANYTKFVNTNIAPVDPTTTPNPITTTSMSPITTTSTTTPSTTTFDPFPPMLGTNNVIDMDWDTYISLNAYGLANLISGVTELIPNRFENIRKITNMATGGCLISSGVAIGINNGFDNASSISTITAGASEIIHNLLPMQTNIDTEMQEITFTNDHARLVNASENHIEYGTRDSFTNVSL